MCARPQHRPCQQVPTPPTALAVSIPGAGTGGLVGCHREAPFLCSLAAEPRVWCPQAPQPLQAQERGSVLYVQLRVLDGEHSSSALALNSEANILANRGWRLCPTEPSSRPGPLPCMLPAGSVKFSELWASHRATTLSLLPKHGSSHL